jgi:hypothetical protein
MNEMRGLFSGDISIVNRPRYRGHISLDVVHAVNAGQLQIKRATAAFWQKAIETILEASHIALLRKRDHFVAEFLGIAGEQLFDQSGDTIFRSWRSPGISGPEGTTADLRPLLSYRDSGLSRRHWLHQPQPRATSSANFCLRIGSKVFTDICPLHARTRRVIDHRCYSRYRQGFLWSREQRRQILGTHDIR